MTEFVRRALNTNIPNLAAQHALLRERIVSEKKNELWASFWPAQPLVPNPVVQQQWTASLSDFPQQATWSDHNTHFVMGDNILEQDTVLFE